MIIGIGGAKRAGKNTAAAALKAKDFRELAFALPLKKICAEAFNLPLAYFDDDSKDQAFPLRHYLQWNEVNRLVMFGRAYGKIDATAVEKIAAVFHGRMPSFTTPREILQFVGTDVFRTCVDSEFWCHALSKEAHAAKKAVVTDVRFPNERRTIRELGGKLILIKRPGLAEDAHASENNLGTDTEYDAIFCNDTTPIALWSAVHDWYNHSIER